MTSSEASAPTCLICSSRSTRLLYELDRFEVHRCSRCDLVFLWPVPPEEVIREMFAQLYTTGDGSVPELRDYYGYCFDDKPGNPLVQTYEAWLDVVEELRPWMIEVNNPL